MNESEKRKWIRKFGNSDNMSHRIIFLPHAGGSANFFHNLCLDLSLDVECIAIQYPGRQDRFDEKMIDSIDEYSNIIAEIIMGLENKPTILFGHSMGALIAYNMLSKHGSKLPFINLFLASAHNPPRINFRCVDYNSMSNNDLIAYLKELGEFNDVLLTDSNIIEIILPAVRNDLQAVSNYHYQGGSKIQVPILAVIGSDDLSTSIKVTSKWADFTEGKFKIIELTGGHFYLIQEQQRLKEIILKAFKDLSFSKHREENNSKQKSVTS
ncbi:alpha/beta fold hydrolase [Bacillus thuringiensis]